MTDIVSNLIEFNPKEVTCSDLCVRKGSLMAIVGVDWRGQRLKAGLACDHQWEMAVGTSIEKSQTRVGGTGLQF